jgi:hypothetical protein
LLPSTGSKRSLLEDEKNISRPNAIPSKRNKAKEKNKRDKRDGARDRSTRGRDANSKEKRHRTGRRHAARVENRDESHNTLKSGPSSTKSIGANEGYNIRGSSAVLRGVITDKTTKTHKREKASKKSSTKNSNIAEEPTLQTTSSGHNIEKRHRTRNAKNGDERLDTFDNDLFTANGRNETDKMETASKRREKRKSSNKNERNSPPGSTISIVIARQRRGEEDNPDERSNTFSNASPTAKRRSRTDKVDETDLKDKKSQRSKTNKRKNNERDCAPDTTSITHWATEVANANEIYNCSNHPAATGRGKNMDKEYRPSGSNVAIVGGYNKMENILELEAATGTRRPRRDKSKKRKSGKSSDTHERRSRRTKSSITIMSGEGATGSTIRIRSMDEGQVLLLSPRGSIEIRSGRRSALGETRRASGWSG